MAKPVRQSMDKINLLFLNCAVSVTIECNPHRAYHESVEEYVNEWGNGNQLIPLDPAVFDQMVQRDTIIFIQYYPQTPNGFYTVWHYDLEAAVEQALAQLAHIEGLANQP